MPFWQNQVFIILEGHPIKHPRSMMIQNTKQRTRQKPIFAFLEGDWRVKIAVRVVDLEKRILFYIRLISWFLIFPEILKLFLRNSGFAFILPRITKSSICPCVRSTTQLGRNSFNREYWLMRPDPTVMLLVDDAPWPLISIDVSSFVWSLWSRVLCPVPAFPGPVRSLGRHHALRNEPHPIGCNRPPSS